MCYLVFTVLGAVVLSTVFFLISRGYISTHPQQQAASQAACPRHFFPRAIRCAANSQ